MSFLIAKAHLNSQSTGLPVIFYKRYGTKEQLLKARECFRRFHLEYHECDGVDCYYDLWDIVSKHYQLDQFELSVFPVDIK